MGNLVDNSHFFSGHLEKMVDESDELPKRLGFSVGIRTCAGQTLDLSQKMADEVEIYGETWWISSQVYGKTEG